jgi:hypothetical protein
MLLFLLYLLFVCSTNADRTCLVPSNTTTCPEGCRLLRSADGAEIVGEFTCADGDVRLCVSPYTVIAASVQRALQEPVWELPDAAGLHDYRVDSAGDGWHVPCARTDFSGSAGDHLLDSVACSADLAEEWYTCVCPAVEEAEVEETSIKVRTTNASYALGHSLGYAAGVSTNDPGVFTSYLSGWFTLSSASTRDLVLLTAGEQVEGHALESADFLRNYTVLQVVDGDVEHEVGASFGWNGTSLVIPSHSLWEFVSGMGHENTYMSACPDQILNVWCVAWLDEGEVVHTNSTAFFVRGLVM